MNLLPEFFVQARDPNLLGGPLFLTLARSLGFAALPAICALCAAAAVLLVAWRARVRGAPASYAALAAIVTLLCFSGRFGVSLDPIGWLCAAVLLLFLEREDMRASIAVVCVTAVWTVLQGGAPYGALLALLAAAGALIDRKRFDAAVVRRFGVAIACVALSLVQLHGPFWHAYGAHALYLDSLLRGAQRDRIWTASISPQALGFAALVAAAGWYGIRRRARSGDALIFFAALALAFADARNLPYFAIVAAPIVVDAAASYYLLERAPAHNLLRSYGIPFAAAVCAFSAIAALVTIRHALPVLPKADPALAGSRVLCVQPRWCDALSFTGIDVVLDDRAGLSDRATRTLQYDVASATGPWQKELRAAKIDAILASGDDALVSLLSPQGWHTYPLREANMVLLSHARHS